MRVEFKPVSSSVAVLTAGKDPHYELGLLKALVRCSQEVDFVANDEMKTAAVAADPLVNYLNLRGCQKPNVWWGAKGWRLIRYYLRLIQYAAFSKTPILHILWFNKFECFDNTLLVLYYRALGKRLVYTVHNVNTRVRDGQISPLNAWSLRFLYRQVQHIFVHTEAMRTELLEEYGAAPEKVSVIPFPINDVTPISSLSQEDARARFGLNGNERIVLFFGNLAPYKGVEYALEAIRRLRTSSPLPVRLLVVGRVKDDPGYWDRLQTLMNTKPLSDWVTIRPEHVPEEEVGVYFQAADVLVLPYTRVYQSGVLFLAYNQGLPVIASDVGALRESVVDGETGFVCRSRDSRDLARKLRTYFESDLFANLESRRQPIRDWVQQTHSWEQVAARTLKVYRELGLNGQIGEDGCSDQASETVRLGTAGDKGGPSF